MEGGELGAVGQIDGQRWAALGFAAGVVIELGAPGSVGPFGVLLFAAATAAFFWAFLYPGTRWVREFRAGSATGVDGLPQGRRWERFMLQVVLFAAAVWLQMLRDDQYRLPASEEETLYLTQRATSRVVFAQRSLASDLYWIRAIQYYGGHAKRAKASVEDALQKLQYDLFYIKHVTLAFDLFVLFSTVKTVLLRRGGQ